MGSSKTPLHLLYFGRYPGEKASALFAAKSAEAFAECGYEVTMWVPKRRNRVANDPYTYFGVQKNFVTTWVSSLDLIESFGLAGITYRLGLVTYAYSVLWKLRDQCPSALIYTNESIAAFILSFRFRHVVFELHDFPEHNVWFHRLLMGRMWRCVVTNTWKKEQLEKRFGVENSRILVELNAVAPHEFELAQTQAGAREWLSLSQEDIIVLYTGHLFRWKGVDTLAQAIDHVPPTTHIYFVGGSPEDVTRFRNEHEHERIHIVGHRPHEEMALWQRAADVAVLPNTGTQAISKFYTSPMKLFEYLAGGIPVVASDLPSVREIVSEHHACLVPPDDARLLAEGIRQVVDDPVYSQTLCANGKALVREHTWHSRAARIKAFLEASL